MKLYQRCIFIHPTADQILVAIGQSSLKDQGACFLASPDRINIERSNWCHFFKLKRCLGMAKTKANTKVWYYSIMKYELTEKKSGPERSKVTTDNSCCRELSFSYTCFHSHSAFWYHHPPVLIHQQKHCGCKNTSSVSFRPIGSLAQPRIFSPGVILRLAKDPNRFRLTSFSKQRLDSLPESLRIYL